MSFLDGICTRLQTLDIDLTILTGDKSKLCLFRLRDNISYCLKFIFLLSTCILCCIGNSRRISIGIRSIFQQPICTIISSRELLSSYKSGVISCTSNLEFCSSKRIIAVGTINLQDLNGCNKSLCFILRGLTNNSIISDVVTIIIMVRVVGELEFYFVLVAGCAINSIIINNGSVGDNYIFTDMLRCSTLSKFLKLVKCDFDLLTASCCNCCIIVSGFCICSISSSSCSDNGSCITIGISICRSSSVAVSVAFAFTL